MLPRPSFSAQNTRHDCLLRTESICDFLLRMPASTKLVHLGYLRIFPTASRIRFSGHAAIA